MCLSGGIFSHCLQLTSPRRSPPPSCVWSGPAAFSGLTIHQLLQGQGPSTSKLHEINKPLAQALGPSSHSVPCLQQHSNTMLPSHTCTWSFCTNFPKAFSTSVHPRARAGPYDTDEPSQPSGLAMTSGESSVQLQPRMPRTQPSISPGHTGLLLAPVCPFLLDHPTPANLLL